MANQPLHLIAVLAVILDFTRTSRRAPGDLGRVGGTESRIERARDGDNRKAIHMGVLGPAVALATRPMSATLKQPSTQETA